MLVGPFWFWIFLVSAKTPTSRNYSPLCPLAQVQMDRGNWEAEPRMLGLLLNFVGYISLYPKPFILLHIRTLQLDWSHMPFLLLHRGMREDWKERMNWFSQKTHESLYHDLHSWMNYVPIWGNEGVQWKNVDSSWKSNITLRNAIREFMGDEFKQSKHRDK